MKFRKKIAMLMILAMIQIPFPTYAAEEDKELSLIAAEQEREEEQLGEINPALTENISTDPTKETDKDKKERKKKLKQTRKEKEKENQRKLKEAADKKSDEKKTKDIKPREETVIIDADEPEIKPVPQITEPEPPQTVEIVSTLDQKISYANFTEVASAVKFIPLYMPRKSGYEITSLYAGQGIAEVRYGRRWEPTVSLTVRTYRRADGEELQDISGVQGVKWRVDTTTGTTIYIAKISETQHVAAWAVGHYTFSAQSENLSFAGFHSLVADELVELSTHYYLDL